MDVPCICENAYLVQKDTLKMLMETPDTELQKEHVTKNKPIEYAIGYYLQKLLKKWSLKEVINARVSNWFDIIDCRDEGRHYTLKITHSLGFSTSQLVKMLIESVFKTYGVKTESIISEKTTFMKY